MPGIVKSTIITFLGKCCIKESINRDTKNEDGSEDAGKRVYCKSGEWMREGLRVEKE